MITICTRWETSQMPPEQELRMWRQLKGAFKITRFIFTPIIPEMENRTIEQYETMEEALEHIQGSKIFLEPQNSHGLKDASALLNLSDFWADEEVAVVLGSTEQGNSLLIDEHGIGISIKTPKPTDIYGMNAAAIALAYWYGQ